MADTASADIFDSDPPRPDRRPLYLVAVSLMLIAVSGFALDGNTALGALSVGAGMFASALVLYAMRVMRKRRQMRTIEQAAAILLRDPAASVIAEADGGLRFLNPAAEARFRPSEHPDDGTGKSVAALLRGMIANPASVVYRLQKKANSRGAASDIVTTRSGQVIL